MKDKQLLTIISVGFLLLTGWCIFNGLIWYALIPMAWLFYWAYL